ncbi:hydrolase [Sphingorhabdus sp. IMCC26285]|uniref:Hydrolase n=1 Tax=Sphingorhabdus profundilacus TaxID=2509718 RepID=A0A6I4LZE5_9SPHN|nr:hydrolase [Sphingorhabdus profundilacus]MVZ97284.1 hydrolase [Sphingorhabdus profundilacus]
MQNLPSSERAALERITHDPMLAQVQQWAAINSGSGNLAGLKATAELLADAFAVLPGIIDLREPAPVEKVRADGVVEIVEHGRHLVVTVRPEAPVQLLFTGHMDTVFPADHSFQQQRWLEDGVLNGPGVADMKGGIAVMLAALTAAETAAEFANVGYQVMINSDEEVGSPSSAPLITALAKGKTAALTYEPALPDGTLAGERGGSGNFSIIFTGKSAHAGRNPQDGRNALLAAADLALRLKALTRPGLNVNPARIEGGSPNNVVPDHAILRVNFRPMTPQIVEETDLALRMLIADIEREHDVSAHVHGSFGRPPKPIDAGAAKLFDLVKQCGADLGLSIAWRASGGVCDGNNIAACGIPVVDTMGVRGGAIHSADEFLITESLVERARLSALTILRIAKKGAL